MAWSSNMLVIEDLTQYKLVNELFYKWLETNPGKSKRTFLNEWRRDGFKKVTYLHYREGQLHEPSGTYFWPVEVFEGQAGLKYRDRCQHCNGAGFIWKTSQ
jgi:hypothetical protein